MQELLLKMKGDSLLSRDEQKCIIGGHHYTDKPCTLAVTDANGRTVTHSGQCVTSGGHAWCGVEAMNWANMPLTSNGGVSRCENAVSWFDLLYERDRDA